MLFFAYVFDLLGPWVFFAVGCDGAGVSSFGQAFKDLAEITMPVPMRDPPKTLSAEAFGFGGQAAVILGGAMGAWGSRARNGRRTVDGIRHFEIKEG